MQGDGIHDRPPRRSKQGGARRLIAGLRITKQDETLLDVVRPLLPEAASEGELAYRLWRRGLEITLAEGVSLGAELPLAITEAHIANLVVQRLLLSMPLLQRTDKLALLGVEALGSSVEQSPRVVPRISDPTDDGIDEAAAAAVVELGGSAFL